MADRYALISVSDKSGIVPFAQKLVEAGYGIISTGGTANRLEDGGVEVARVAELTGFPEILDGRVKTLHPKIHGGLLARRDVDDHVETLDTHDIPDIRIVAVNLYPFRKTIAQEETTFEDAIENIDIGGPTLLRASAKNHESVTVVVDSADYGRVAEAAANETLDIGLRRELALKAFQHTSSYDSAIVEYLEGELESDASAEAEGLPGRMDLNLVKNQELRYGENPHQKGALYTREGDRDFGGLEKLHGKALSYNNIVDLDAALDIIGEFDDAACAIIKHTNPAGCALGSDLEDAYDRALACDPMSSFGGIVALNRGVDASLAEKLNDHFFEIVAAPAFDEAALEVLTQKKNLRLMRVPEGLAGPEHVIRATSLGYLIQQVDPLIDRDFGELDVPTERQPSVEELAALEFVWQVCKHVKSNAIVIGDGTRTLGVGAGQMSRVDAVKIAVDKAREALDGAVLASDAFFPFRDGVDAAAEAGVRAIVQPGGSRRDQEVIDACDEHGIAMVMTGNRHFRH
ncbi:MAG: bifunctional phosphoribosylaminoimidazolecarboxamide formyltransferase/IMP cyclohydrolase [Persicimonas sp.]